MGAMATEKVTINLIMISNYPKKILGKVTEFGGKQTAV